MGNAVKNRTNQHPKDFRRFFSGFWGWCFGDGRKSIGRSNWEPTMNLHGKPRILGFVTRREDSLEAVHRVLHFEFARCWGGVVWGRSSLRGMADHVGRKNR